MEGQEPHAPSSAILVLDFQLLLDKGIHQDLFDDLVSDAISSSWSFWRKAKDENL